MSNSKAKFGVIGMIALICIAIVLRPPVASLGPLLQEIISSLSLNPVQTSVLTSAPVLCFGVGAFAGPWLVSKLGVNHALFTVLVVLAGALVLRMFFGYAGLLTGTIAAGLSIAVANVLLPTVVRKNFPNKVALVTGSYTTTLAISASLAASIAVPTSSLLGGWNPALAIWLAPSVLAVILWLPQIRNQEPHIAQAAHAAAAEKQAVNRSPIAWAIVAFFGLQSLGFYALLGWLPTALTSIGISPADAGNYLAFASGIGIPFGLVASSLLSRSKTLAWWASGTSFMTLSGFSLLLAVIATRDISLLIPASLLIGFGMSATFPISLSLISSRASTQAQTTQLSAMAQGWGYLIAAIGSFSVGLIANATGTWVASFVLLAALGVIQVAVGFYSGRPGEIPVAPTK